MALTMTKEEREASLADIHVAVISVAEDGHGPLVVPLWYSYEPGGEVRIVTGRAARKGKLLERAGRFSLCVQTETLPYKYVSVEGPIVAIEAADLRAAGRSPCALRRSEISATGERVRIFHTLRDTTRHASAVAHQ
jgi:nitroimidazol reductase NimA-like FMN-containing flavoprotein (pyridoxamine 5'-phosphate oxidase superfamily)